MQLNFDQIKKITLGTSYITHENGVFDFHRFTCEQEELYKKTKPDFYKKTQSSSGIKLLFKTDSKSLFLEITTASGSSFNSFSVDIFVDGKLLDCLDNISGKNSDEIYSYLPFGDFSKEFNLGDGIKTVCIHLPWSVKTSIKQIAIDDGAFIEAIKPQKKMLSFGDSITQGYLALRPSNRYASKLAAELGAEEFNKGIGGELFFPELAMLKDSISPDYITVAYGTNDWFNNRNEELFTEKCSTFYTNLSRNYPEAKIFAITPIWRKDLNETKALGAFENVEKCIRNATEHLENVTVISGFDLVPKDENMFGDLFLHPNDEGFRHYGENLSEAVKHYL